MYVAAQKPNVIRSVPPGGAKITLNAIEIILG